MKKFVSRIVRRMALLALLTPLAHSHAQVVSSLDDILFWTGTGPNRAGLVVDFNDGESRESFAWGYRWDGIATGAQMLTAVAEADPNFSILFGGSVADGFFLTQASYFDGVFDHLASSGDFVSDFRYWSYFVVGGTAGGTLSPPSGDPVVPGPDAAFPSTWSESPSGASFASFGSLGRILENEAWDGWSFGEFPVPQPGTTYAAIPEPGSLVLMMSALPGFMILKRRRSSHGRT